QFVFTTGRQAPQAEERHWLSYPVTNHSVAAWGNLRLPNQLRFKVRKTPENKLIGVIFHMPHRPPEAFNPNQTQIECVWRCVHAFLDAMHHAPTPQWSDCSCLEQGARQRRNTRLDAWWAHVAAADRALVKLTRIPE
ncbi:MAG: hypothetical protein RMK02_11225, partial [Burkholderiales bacterium]|nr:hypothetical protein [Burkholderiales bacterium]